MKNIFKLSIAIAFAMTAIMVSFADDTSSSDNAITYQIGDNMFAVTIPQDGISEDEAKELAMKKAAEICKKNGYQYFTITSEGTAYVMKSQNQDSSPSNLNYEMVQSDNFGKNPVGQDPNAKVTFMNGWNIKFSCSKEKMGEKAIDACRYTNCAK
jgi:hypothetical protein